MEKKEGTYRKSINIETYTKKFIIIYTGIYTETYMERYIQKYI